MLRLWASGRAYNDDIVAASLVPAWVLLLSVTGAYDGWRIGSAGEEVRRIITAGLRTAGLVAVASYGLQLHLSRLFLIAAISSGTVAVLAGRGAVRLGLHRLRRDGRCVHRVVVAGHAPDVQHLVEQSQRASSAGFRVVAACVPGKADWLPLIDGSRLPVLGEPVDVGTVSRAAGADVVAVASDSVLGRHEMRRLAWELEGTDTRLLVAPRLTDVAGPRISVRPLAGLPLLNVDQPRFSGINRAMKGVIDRTVAAVAIVLLLPLLLVVVVAIRLGSRGRALFCQERAGLDGAPFTCWKLRSMVHDADRLRSDVEHLNHHPGGVLFKAPGDPRITRVGRWLRRTSVDELPQLWNVLRGQMSLVGPRPPLMTEVDAYEQDVRRRLLVKPGLTGLWQVSWALGALVGGVGAARPVLRGELVPHAGHRDHSADLRGYLQQARSVLRLARRRHPGRGGSGRSPNTRCRDPHSQQKWYRCKSCVGVCRSGRGLPVNTTPCCVSFSQSVQSARISPYSR